MIFTLFYALKQTLQFLCQEYVKFCPSKYVLKIVPQVIKELSLGKVFSRGQKFLRCGISSKIGYIRDTEN